MSIGSVLWPPSLFSYVVDAYFSGNDIRTILRSLPSLPYVLAGVVFVPVKDVNNIESLELRAVYCDTGGNIINYGPSPLFFSPTSQSNANIIRSIFFPKPLQEIELVFFHRDTLDFLVNDPRFGIVQEINVSRVNIDYKNGDAFQNLKIRAVLPTAVQATEIQILSIAHAIGVSCPPDWYPAKPGIAGTIYYIDQCVLKSFQITIEMLKKLVYGPSNPPGTNG